MTISADSLAELNKNTKLLETVMQTRLFYIKPATFQKLKRYNRFFLDQKTNSPKKETWIAQVQRSRSHLFLPN